jgi:hypothetical protein
VKKPKEDRPIPGVRNPVVFREFARWAATPKYLRVTLGLPKTMGEFAEFKGIGERTVRRWKAMPEFEELVAFEKERIARESSKNSAVSVNIGMPQAPQDPRIRKRLTDEKEPVGWDDDLALDEQVSEGEMQYRQVRQRLVHMAMEGSTQAADLFMKHWGKSFVEAEQQDVGYQEFSDQELVEEVVKLVGSERFSQIVANIVIQ